MKVGQRISKSLCKKHLDELQTSLYIPGLAGLLFSSIVGSVTGILLLTKPFWVYYHFIWTFLFFRNEVVTLFVR